MAKKPTNFYHLKKDCELITKVALSIKEGNNNSGLIKDIYGLKEALTKMQIVSREYRKHWKIIEGEGPKTKWYRERRSDQLYQIDKRMCFYQQFKDLSTKNYLTVIRVASKKMANKCMKCYRDTGAECAKRYYSLFRALEKQIHRLDTTLGKKVYELENKIELINERTRKGKCSNKWVEEQWVELRKELKTLERKGKVYYFRKLDVNKYQSISKEEYTRLVNKFFEEKQNPYN